MADETVTEPVNTAAPEEQATTPAPEASAATPAPTPSPLPCRNRTRPPPPPSPEDSGDQAARCRPGRRHRRLFRG